MKIEPEESLGYDNREPKGQAEYAKGQHDLCCQELGLEPRHDREGDTLLEAISSLKKDRDDWKAEAALRSKETEVWKHEAEIVRKQLESEHETAIDWFIAYQEIKDALKRASNELGVPQPGYPAPVANAANILKYALDKAKKAETSLDSENSALSQPRSVDNQP